MKKIDIDKDKYIDEDYGISVPIGFAVLSGSNRQGDKMFYACDKIYNLKGDLIIPIDEHFKSIDEIAARSGQTYYITEDEYFRHSYVQNQKHGLQ